MPRTPDRTPGPSIEEELQLEDGGADPSVVGALTLNAGALLGRDTTGIFDLRGLSEEDHKILRQLIHFIDDGPAEGFTSGAYKETLPAGSPFPTSEIWWESSSKLKKIVSLVTTWTGAVITQEVWDIYDTDGSTSLATITDGISYSGIFETSRTRTIVVH